MELYSKMKRFLSRKLFNLKKIYYKNREQNKSVQGETLSHITCYATGNSGDTTLSKCIRKTINILGNYNHWNIVDVRARVITSCIRRMNKTKGIIVGGGGLFLPDTNENKISGWQWAISKEQLDEVKVPIIIYSVGYNYFRGQSVNDTFKKNLSYLIKRASFVGLRNTGSVHKVQELLDEEFRRKIVYQPCTTTLIRKIFYDTLPEKQKTNIIAFNLAFDREELRYGGDKELILRQIAKTAKLIEARGYQIIYVLHCGLDRKFIPYLQEERVNFKLFNTSLWFPDQIIQFYNDIDLVFGMRGHSQMIPFGLNCEIISLGTHDKILWFLEDIDAADWYEELTYEPANLSSRLLAKFIKIHEEDQKQTKKRLLEQQERLWEITVKNWQQISKILE